MSFNTTIRHTRNDRVVRLRNQGHTVKQIAEEAGLTERHVYRILRERGVSTVDNPLVGHVAAKDDAASPVELLDALEQNLLKISCSADELVRYVGGGALSQGLTVRLARMHAESILDELRARAVEFADAAARSADTDGA
jgi:AraC-like DNA-binding protein